MATDLRLPRPDQALPGRPEAMPVSETHLVTGQRQVPPFPEPSEQAIFEIGRAHV